MERGRVDGHLHSTLTAPLLKLSLSPRGGGIHDDSAPASSVQIVSLPLEAGVLGSFACLQASASSPETSASQVCRDV